MDNYNTQEKWNVIHMAANCDNCSSYKNRKCTHFGKPEPRSIATEKCYRRRYGVSLPMLWMPSDEYWSKLIRDGVPKYAVTMYKAFVKEKEAINKRFGLCS